MPNQTALAIFAHPDDIEFVAAGTLLQLNAEGWDAHYLNLSSGNGGSTTMDPQTTRIARARESRAACEVLNTTWHAPIADDLEILYTSDLIRRLSKIIREVNPRIVFTHGPSDYMEDHMNTCRLALTAAFTRGMTNFRTEPPSPSLEKAGDVTVYHAQPHGNRDPLRRLVVPGAFVDTTDVHDKKRSALACHASQKDWLDASQGMDSYLITCDSLSTEVGKMSGRFNFAEGWRRHSHLGYSEKDDDPLAKALGKKYLLNAEYERSLE
jgi:LmbE family N-acetylglucosaminyl deacetylase